MAEGSALLCGERGIRTLGPVARTTVFETAPIDHSGISPDSPCPKGVAAANITEFPEVILLKKTYELNICLII